jgi:1,4-dihydroxy-2-naphthoate polyprenyltransferase
MTATRLTTKLSVAIRAARPLAHANIAPALLLGQALAYRLDGRFSLTALAYVHLFGVLDHLFIVLANDYADREADTSERTLVSGGSGVIVEGRVRAETVRRAAIAAGIALVLLGLVHGPVMLGFALAAIALMLAYSYAPLRLSYRGHGEWLQGLGVGLLLPWVGFYVQSGSLAAPPGVLFGAVLLATASNVVTAMPDLASDARALKRTLPVRLGVRRSSRLAELGTLFGVLLLVILAPIDLEARVIVAPVALVPLASSASRPRDDSSSATLRWALGMGASHQLAILGLSLALWLAA